MLRKPYKKPSTAPNISLPLDELNEFLRTPDILVIVVIVVGVVVVVEVVAAAAAVAVVVVADIICRLTTFSGGYGRVLDVRGS